MEGVKKLTAPCLPRGKLTLIVVPVDHKGLSGPHSPFGKRASLSTPHRPHGVAVSSWNHAFSAQKKVV